MTNRIIGVFLIEVLHNCNGRTIFLREGWFRHRLSGHINNLATAFVRQVRDHNLHPLDFFGKSTPLIVCQDLSGIFTSILVCDMVSFVSSGMPFEV